MAVDIIVSCNRRSAFSPAELHLTRDTSSHQQADSRAIDRFASQLTALFRPSILHNSEPLPNGVRLRSPANTSTTTTHDVCAAPRSATPGSPCKATVQRVSDCPMLKLCPGATAMFFFGPCSRLGAGLFVLTPACGRSRQPPRASAASSLPAPSFFQPIDLGLSARGWGTDVSQHSGTPAVRVHLSRGESPSWSRRHRRVVFSLA
jgi:hypothetical protein